MRPSPTPILLALLAVSLGTPQPARAADYTEQQLDTFKQNLAAGTKAYNADNFETALKKYRAARAAIDEPRLTYRIALTYEKLGNCPQARNAYATFLDKTTDDSELTSQRESAADKLNSLRTECPPQGQLTVRCDPREASVRISGDTYACPASVSLPEGQHTVEASADGYQSATATVTVDADQTTTTKLVMTPLPDDSQPDARSAWRTYGPWVTIGTGAALIGAGVISDASAISRANEFDRARRNGDTARIDSLRRQARASKTRTWVLYGSGLAVATGGAIWYVLDRPSPETKANRSAHLTVLPQLSPSSLGLRLQW